MPTSDVEDYRQNAARCEAHAGQLEAAGNVTLANLYREMAIHWRSLAEQVERNRF